MKSARLMVAFASALSLVLASCSSATKAKTASTEQGGAKNPYKPGTYDYFKAEKKYPKTYDVWKNDALLTKTDASNSRLVLSIPRQRGMLLNGDDVVMDYPISTGRKSHPTPVGEYKILERTTDKASNRYGKILDATGEIVNGDADVTTDVVPEGGSFVGAPMPYWMRLTWDGVGHHIGKVPRYPASHACIRGPRSVMPTVFSKVKVGTRVTVEG